MRIKVSPTRMEFLKIRRRLAVARRGHKLLKDKLEGLMKEFLERISSYRSLRRRVDSGLPAVLALFAVAQAAAGTSPLRAILESCRPSSVLDAHPRKIMGITVPGTELALGAFRPYSLLDAPCGLDAAVARMRGFAAALVELASSEETVRRLAREVEKTRRRVNALEHVMIPGLVEARKFIAGKLDENERGNITRLMKIKEMIRRQAESSPAPGGAV